ncbi:MAG: hypothetical protein K0U84_01590 [Actinomycetia bacterium]|nr:hypothetical protein [Actinomycetes bacterium]
MALVTITGNTIREAGTRKDNRAWAMRSVAYQYGGGTGGVVTTGGDWQELQPVAGILTFTAEAGIAAFLRTPDNHEYLVRIPEADAGLWDVIEAGIAFPPNTAQDRLDAAVRQYVETNRSDFRTRAVLITEGEDAGKAQWVDESDVPTGDPVEWSQVVSEDIASIAAAAAAPDAVDADLAARDITFTDEGDGEGYFSIGGSPVSGTLVPPAATWSGVAGRPSTIAAGVIGDGSTDDRAALATSDDTALAAGLPLMLPPGTYKVSSNITIDSPVWFAGDAILKPDDGVTVTLAGGIAEAPPSQIFDQSAGGTVVVAWQDLLLEWFGALDSTGATSASAILEDAINSAGASTRAGFGSGTASQPVTLRIPLGVFLIDQDISVDVENFGYDSPARVDAARLYLAGAGEGATVLNVSATNGIKIKDALITIQNIRFYSAETANTILQLGDSAGGINAQVNQSTVQRCSFHGGGTQLKFRGVDSSFRDILFRAANVCMMDVFEHDTNSNLLMFDRCHFELMAVGGTMVKINGGSAAANRHHGITFGGGCHFETNRPEVTCVEITNSSLVTFLGNQFIQDDAFSSPSPKEAVLPMFRFIDVGNINFENCEISAISPDASSPANLNKLFSLGGSVKGLRIEASYINPKIGSSNAGVDHLYQSDATTPLTSYGLNLMELVNTFVGSGYSLLEAGPEAISVNSTTSKSKRWEMRYADNDLDFLWSNSAATLPSTPMMSITQTGQLSTASAIISGGSISANGNAIGERVAVPANSSAPGSIGQWAINVNYLFVCVSTDTWVRVAVASW